MINFFADKQNIISQLNKKSKNSDLDTLFYIYVQKYYNTMVLLSLALIYRF